MRIRLLPNSAKRSKFFDKKRSSDNQEESSIADMHHVDVQEKSLQELKYDLYSWSQTNINCHNVFDSTNYNFATTKGNKQRLMEISVSF